MKSLILVLVILCASRHALAQIDLIDRIAKQAIEVDSLKKVISADFDKRELLIKENLNLRDTLKMVKTDLAKLEAFRADKNKIETLLRQKTDSMGIVMNIISDRDKQIIVEKQNSVQKEKGEYEKGKNQMLSTMLGRYKNKPFDELLKSSTLQTTQLDLQLAENSTEIKQIISDLEKYFIAQKLLNTKLDAAQIGNALNQLDQIKRESTLLGKLKELIGNYKTVNDGLKEIIGKILALDNSESVSGLNNEIKKKKFDKILSQLSSYIFNYDFDFRDYPYLADVFLEIVKRKFPNPDADISDLSKKL
jgi:hypothetical protein